MVMVTEGIFLGLTTTEKVRAKFPDEDVRAGHRLVRVHAGEPAAGCGCPSRGSSAGRTPSAPNVRSP